MSDKRYCLVATAKNEGPYFLEWVAHHLEVGFTDIIIFQNDSDDKTHQILKRLEKIGVIKYYYNRAVVGRHQVRAYTRATKTPEYQAADWAMALDLDEFLAIKTPNSNLDELLAATPECDVMAINWRRFGSGGITDLNGELVTQRFLYANNQIDGNTLEPFKTFFRRSSFIRPGVHLPHNYRGTADQHRLCNGSGLREDGFSRRNFQSTDPEGCKLAQVNHYMVRDAASFVLKSDRGSAHQAHRLIDSKYWTRWNKNLAKDSFMETLRPRIEARMQALDDMAEGQLSALRDRAIELHQEKFAELMKVPEQKDFYDFCVDRGHVPEAVLKAS